MRISDWSSDVCSSDLLGDQFLGLGRVEELEIRLGHCGRAVLGRVGVDQRDRRLGEDRDRRHADVEFAGAYFFLRQESSEERRGGKGCVRTCRSRWSPAHEKKQKI